MKPTALTIKCRCRGQMHTIGYRFGTMTTVDINTWRPVSSLVLPINDLQHSNLRHTSITL